MGEKDGWIDTTVSSMEARETSKPGLLPTERFVDSTEKLMSKIRFYSLVKLVANSVNLHILWSFYIL